MGYKILNNDFYRSSVGPTGLQLGVEYDPTTGDYRLREQNLLRGALGAAVFYQNGNWTNDAIQDPQLFTNNDPSKPTARANQLSEDIRRATNAAYLRGGGQNKGLKIDPTAQNPTTTAGVQNYFPGTNPGIATAIPIVGSILSGALFDLNIKDLKSDLQFGSIDENLKINLQYPKDALYNKTQDYLQIGQFHYQPPKSDELFGGTDGAVKILKNGLQKTSALKKYLGIVKLPMPNNVTDSNNVSWGDDNMNNLSAAATAEVIGDLGKYAGAALGGTAIGGVTGVSGGGGLAVKTAILSALGGGLINSKSANALFKTGVGSQVLSMAGFSVSPESILARGFGVVPNSNLELLFNSPTLREFTFQYRMSPRSKEEATDINKIIRFFKQGMAAKKQDKKSGTNVYGSAAGASSYFLGTPNVFQLQYKTSNGNPIQGVNRIKTCALVGFSMNYTADGTWAAYDDGQPVSVIMNMSFKELEPIYDTDYQSVIFDGRNADKNLLGDLYPISPNDVGY